MNLIVMYWNNIIHQTIKAFMAVCNHIKIMSGFTIHWPTENKFFPNVLAKNPYGAFLSCHGHLVPCLPPNHLEKKFLSLDHNLRAWSNFNANIPFHKSQLTNIDGDAHIISMFYGLLNPKTTSTLFSTRKITLFSFILFVKSESFWCINEQTDLQLQKGSGR